MPAIPSDIPEQGRRTVGIGILVGAVLLTGYLAYLVTHAAFAVGGSDSSGYLNTARRLRDGTLVSRPRSLDRLGLSDDQAQTCIPLGFMTGPKPGTMAPLYPIGFPAHLLAAATVAGWDWGPYVVSPLAAAACVLLCYLLGRDLGLSPAVAGAAAAVLAVWPVFLFQALQPMSDAVATAWAIAAVLFARRARFHAGWAAAAGAAFGITVLVRPTSVLLLFPLAFALPISKRSLLLFGSGGFPFAALWAAYNLLCYGHILKSGYGATGHLEAFAFSHFPARFLYYGLHLLKTFAVVVPVTWLLLMGKRNVPGRDRALLFSWFAGFLVLFCFYGPYESFIFVRFLLPGVPALVLAAALATPRVDRHRSPRLLTAAILAVVCLVAVVEVRTARRLGIQDVIRDQSVYPESCRWAQAQIPRESVLLASQVTGALEHYTDTTYLRYDWLEAWNRASVASNIEHEGDRENGHKGRPWFALIFQSEEQQLQKHVPGIWTRVGSHRDVGLWKLEQP